MHSGTSGKVRSITLEQRIGALVQLGKLFSLFGGNAPWPGHSSGLNEVEFAEFNETVTGAQHRNGWFTEENVRHMLKSLALMLDEQALHEWSNTYQLAIGTALSAADQPTTNNEQRTPRTIGIITAGNIPLVGFHDLLCVLISGNRARVKCSSDDARLTPAVVKLLGHIAPDLAAQVVFAEGKLGEVDALIATGSNNTTRYFDHYFKEVPRIVRKGRTSIAILDGSETEEELTALGEDIFRYFGLGCRSVTKLCVPRDFDLDRLFKAIYPWNMIALHNKYANNYDYHKAIWLMDRVPLLENGFILLKEDEGLTSPVGSLYYQRHDDRSALNTSIASKAESIQCIVGHGHVPFGQAQCPGIGDYADGVDTMEFLIAL